MCVVRIGLMGQYKINKIKKHVNSMKNAKFISYSQRTYASMIVKLSLHLKWYHPISSKGAHDNPGDHPISSEGARNRTSPTTDTVDSTVAVKAAAAVQRRQWK